MSFKGFLRVVGCFLTFVLLAVLSVTPSKAHLVPDHPACEQGYFLVVRSWNKGKVPEGCPGEGRYTGTLADSVMLCRDGTYEEVASIVGLGAAAFELSPHREFYNAGDLIRVTSYEASVPSALFIGECLQEFGCSPDKCLVYPNW